MKVKTASDIKIAHEANHPESLFFTRNNMKFLGDTMRNYGVRETQVTTYDGETIAALELYRRKPVKMKAQGSAYFHPETFARIHPVNAPKKDF